MLKKCPVFRFNDNKTKVQCKVCTAGVPEGLRLWIFPQSGAKHLQSDDHKKASELVEDAKRKAEERERERLAESATRDLRELTFAAASNVRGPVHSMTSSNGPSLAEREFWDDYAVNGADFSAGDPADDSDIQIGRLREQVGAFGLWNPEKAARQLGFGDEDVAGQILNVDEEEDFLAEIIRAAGECREMVRFRPNMEVALRHRQDRGPADGGARGLHSPHFHRTFVAAVARA